MKSKKERRKFHIGLVIIIAVIVVFFDVLFVMFPDRGSSDTENRNLQQFPKLTWNTLTSGRFESQLDNYIADQFPGRDTWVGVETTVSRLAGNTESNGVFLGKDGYLIQNFKEPSEEKFKEKVKSFTDFKAAHTDLDIYTLIAPTAVNILVNKLPAFAITGDENAFMDKLFSELKDSGINVIDVRNRFIELEGKKEMQLYYRTDHHWTTDAAYEAYKVWAAKAIENPAKITYDRLLVTTEFQGTLSASSGFRRDDSDDIYVYLQKGSENITEEQNQDMADDSEKIIEYTVINMDDGRKSASFYDTSYLTTRDKYGMFFGGNHGRMKIETTSESERTIMVIKDSYANCFMPFLAPDFRKIVVIDPRYFTGDIDDVVSEEEVTDVLYLFNAQTLAE